MSHPPTLTFNIQPITQFSKQDIAVRRPREITYFSYDDESHTYHQDASSLRYYYPPTTLPTDLNKGFSSFRQLDDSSDEHLDGLLRSLIYYESESESTSTSEKKVRGKKLDIDFITWRGMMTKIMVVPFSPLDSWEMNATLFQGTVFIEENHAHKLAAREQQYGAGAVRGAMSQDLMSYWGYKFESVCLLAQHWCHSSRAEIEGREEERVSNFGQYCSVVRTGFGRVKMVIGGEVDAVQGGEPHEQDQEQDQLNAEEKEKQKVKGRGKSEVINWVELKTTAELVNEKEVGKYERKLMKFWAQSFLLGVPKIIVGFRDQQGWLRRLEELDTQSIPDGMLQSFGGGRQKVWDGQTCINFTSAFLDWLKQTITSEGVWRIKKREKSSVIEVFRVEESGTGSILSDEFIEWRTESLPNMLAAQETSGVEHIQNGKPP